MMRKALFTIIALCAVIFVSCKSDLKTDGVAQQPVEQEGPDTMIYGLACDGTNDSVVVLLLFSGEDPITYNIETAKKSGKIIGQMQIGDWIGVMPSQEDSTEATMVVDLDQLKGTWTYEVRPTWKDASRMSRRALKNKMAEIPDSLKEAYMVPREYGFTLKRSSKASPVGHVMRASSLEDDSPVEYPEVKNYTGWKCRNGRLILISTKHRMIENTDEKENPIIRDTLDFVMMTNDSLILTKKTGETIHFHRHTDAASANAEATKAAMKVSEAKKEAANKESEAIK